MPSVMGLYAISDAVYLLHLAVLNVDSMHVSCNSPTPCTVARYGNLARIIHCSADIKLQEAGSVILMIRLVRMCRCQKATSARQQRVVAVVAVVAVAVVAVVAVAVVAVVAVAMVAVVVAVVAAVIMSTFASGNGGSRQDSIYHSGLQLMLVF